MLWAVCNKQHTCSFCTGVCLERQGLHLRPGHHNQSSTRPLSPLIVKLIGFLKTLCPLPPVCHAGFSGTAAGSPTLAAHLPRGLQQHQPKLPAPMGRRPAVVDAVSSQQALCSTAAVLRVPLPAAPPSAGRLSSGLRSGAADAARRAAAEAAAAAATGPGAGGGGAAPGANHAAVPAAVQPAGSDCV